MFQEDWRRHFRVNVVVVVYEGEIAHSWFLLYEDRHLGNFSEARRIGVASFQDHLFRLRYVPKVWCNRADRWGSGNGGSWRD